MFRRGEVSTEVDKKPFIFTLAAFAVSLVTAVLLFVLGGGDGLAVFAGILLAVIAVLSGTVLFAMVTDRAWIGEGVLHMGYLFRKAAVPLAEIGKVTYRDEVYSVYDRKGALRGTMNGRLTGIGKVLHEMDRQGVPFA